MREQHPAGVRWDAPLSVQRDRGREHGREWLGSVQLPGKSEPIIPRISQQEARTIPNRRRQSDGVRPEEGRAKGFLLGTKKNGPETAGGFPGPSGVGVPRSRST